MRIIHCYIFNDFTLPWVITLAIRLSFDTNLVIKALGTSRNLIVSLNN